MPEVACAPPAPAVAAQWRARIAAGRETLRREYLQRPRPARLLRGLSALIDRVLIDAAAHSGLPPQVALLAVGGYGRRELFPYSDVDLLILLDAEPDTATGAALECFITFLWDIGLEVGHSVRTIEQCVEEARKDISVETNLLEARWLTGNRALARRLTRALAATRVPAAFFEAKLLEQQQRHARFHDTAYNLEPNLKETPGGLRDLQHILWVCRALGIGGHWSAVVRSGLLCADEARHVRQAERLLQDLRIRLHFLARRREDRLLFDHQDSLARELGLAAKGGRSAAEMLMQRYYRAAKTITLAHKIMLLDLQRRITPLSPGPALPIDADFTNLQGLLQCRRPDLFDIEPAKIFTAFALLQHHGELSDFSPDTWRALLRCRHRIDAAFRRDPANRARFIALLRARRGVTRVLRHMNQAGVLGRYLPAFGRIVGQMQHDLFHVYTVDEHILFVVRNLRRFTLPEFAHEYPLCSRLMSNFERPEVLYLAGLFHDIAKGRGGDHSTLGALEARRFCRAHGLSQDDTELVAWLVQHHLTLSATAQKEDLSDPAVIEAFAAKVGNLRRLTALYLLTVADIRGTSPKVWNAWKGKLLEDLFRATRRLLTDGAVPIDQQMELRKQEARQQLRADMLPAEADHLFWRELDDSYFLRHTVREIAWHTRHLYRHVHTQSPIVRARAAPNGEGIQVMIYTSAQADLFARICAFFERINYTVVEAKLYTTPHGYALHTFVVLDVDNTVQSYRDLLSFIEFELARRIADPAPPEPPLEGRVSRQLKHFPIEPRVSIVADERGQYHVLSITAGDRPGLLSRIAQTLLAHCIELDSAKINTLGERAEDTFLVHAEDDRLNSEKLRLRLETDLLAALRTQ